MPKKECPTCETKFTTRSALKDPPGVTRPIGNLKRRCSEANCVWKNTVCEFENHIKVCPEVKITCPEEVI